MQFDININNSLLPVFALRTDWDSIQLLLDHTHPEKILLDKSLILSIYYFAPAEIVDLLINHGANVNTTESLPIYRSGNYISMNDSFSCMLLVNTDQIHILIDNGFFFNVDHLVMSIVHINVTAFKILVHVVDISSEKHLKKIVEQIRYFKNKYFYNTDHVREINNIENIMKEMHPDLEF